MSFEQHLSSIVHRHQELESLLAHHPDPSSKDYRSLSIEYANLGPVVLSIREYLHKKVELQDLETMMQDPNFKSMAEDEYYALQRAMPEYHRQVQLSLIPKDPDDLKNAIVEVRAGTGGEEAALFAADLFRMYQKYAAFKGFGFEILSYADTGLGGVKEAVGLISGTDVFAKFKFESGVHRVQRVPETEASGRIHTSAATVAVLAEAEDVEITIEDKDLRIDTYRSQGSGGQHVNKTDSAIRITHLPSGLVVAVQDEKSQHKNRAKAFKILQSRLLDMKKTEEASKRAHERKSQVGSGDRSERIRTYNFPQGRVTDHRIDLTLYQLDEVLNGDGLQVLIDSLISADQAAKLAEL